MSVTKENEALSLKATCPCAACTERPNALFDTVQLEMTTGYVMPHYLAFGLAGGTGRLALGGSPSGVQNA
ncbi:hypothetical protein ARSEF1564_009546 [Beauveria bassiana]